MTKKEKELFDLLISKGIMVTSVWYEHKFSWDSSRGWYAETEEAEYHLGRDFIEAKGQIINNEISLSM